MIVLSGEFSGHRSPMLPLLKQYGWGRLWARDKPQWSYDGEPWAVDNGAFSAWRKGLDFPADTFVKRVNAALAIAPHPPLFAVLPDKVAAGRESLWLSVEWLGWCKQIRWPWYIAVQDGMTVNDVAPLLRHVDGIFLGGSDDFKRQARRWCDFAHSNGKQFHYARCGREAWVREALDIEADSIDSTALLRRLTDESVGRFGLLRDLLIGCDPQPQLF